MKIILSHPTGNANVRAITKALAEADLLTGFYTCIAVFKNSWSFFLSRFGPLKELRRRSFAPVLKAYTHTRPYKEIGRLASQRLDWQRALAHEKGIFSVDSIYRDLDSHVSTRLKNVRAVYSYEDGALRSFQEAKLKEIKCLYDLPTGYWRAHRNYLDIERERRPEWAMTFRCFNDSEEKLSRKDRELAMADEIFVASDFTRRTLDLFPGPLAPVHLIPYGFPGVHKVRTYDRLSGRKLRLLFVGGLSQLKGVANLLEAAEHFKGKIDLTIVGREVVKGCKPLEDGLRKHNWIPSLPNHEVLKLMRTQDVFVFPSLFEGYGLVIAEAMSQGTPVITTNRTCGADFIRNGENGWLINAGDTMDLVKTIGEILSGTHSVSEVGRAASATAERLPMSFYGENMVKKIKQVIYYS